MTIRPFERLQPHATLRRSIGSRVPIRLRPQPGYDNLRPTWRDARPARIAESLRLSQQQSAGGWYVVGESRELSSSTSLVRQIAGREVVLWRADDGTLRAGPGSCPHLGALLDGSPVVKGDVVCRWHGLALGDRGHGDWQPFAARDDGALLWARIQPLTHDPATHDLGPTEDPEPLSPAPIVGARPPLDQSVSAVITRRGRCEPVDIVANRLDPWHGAWFHPYSFSHLRVDDDASTPDRLLVDVTFRLNRRLGVPVRAEFVCPDRRTIVMRIVDGEGVGSVVETHATPLTAPGDPQPETVMTELTVAYSDRPGFVAARRLAGALRPAMRHVARRLWVDDLTYAERRYELRRRGEFPG
jgi:hypothetical protein